MDRDPPARSPLAAFTRRQTELNRFFWTTELVYEFVKKEKVLDRLPQDRPVREALGHVDSQAWFPTAKSRSQGAATGKYRGTIGEMRKQIDANFVVVRWTVVAMFIAEFETFVQTRFAGWYEQASSRKKGPFMIPPPARLLASLRTYRAGKPGKPIDPKIVLRADLMKTIRNLYVHKGLRGIPRKVEDDQITAWIAQVSKESSPYSAEQAADVVRQVVGKAVTNSEGATKIGKSLGPEFFYALFTFTNIRNFVLALDRSFPADPKRDKPKAGPA